MRLPLLALCLALAAACPALAGCAQEPTAPSPDQAAVFARAVDAELVVASAPNAMRYATERIEAPAGATVRVVMDNSGTSSPTMVHNVVVLQTAEAVRRVGGAAAGNPDGVPNDPAVLAATPLAGPGQRTAVVFTMPAAGEYPFICTYPGHFQFMRGTLVSTAG